MLKIKLSRTGSKNHPTYRVVVLPQRSKLTGQALDIIGYYLPLENKFSIDNDKVNHWTNKGAQLTPKVSSLIKSFAKS